MIFPRTSADADKAERDEALREAPRYRYRPLYAVQCLPDAEWQRAKLEALRYKWRYRATDVRVMRAVRARFSPLLPWLAWAFYAYMLWSVTR